MTPKYKLGQTVYLITDVEQLPRMVTGITLRPNTILYSLSLSVNETTHYEMEISSERDILKATT
jgi:hypothetical protein